MGTGHTDVVVVGSGPNGLATAVTLARAGLSLRVLEAQSTAGGGTRTDALGTRGLRLHRADADAERIASLPRDLCSAVHPLAVASPFLRAFDLVARGVELATPEASYAHPLTPGPRGRAAVAYRDLERTVAALGADGGRWQRVFDPLVRDVDVVAALALDDRRRIASAGRRPVPGSVRAGVDDLSLGDLARLVRAGAAFARGLVSRPFGGEAGALFAGAAVHAMSPLAGPAAGGTGLLLATLGHCGGWPVPVGGSQAIADALLADLAAHGVHVETGHRVRRRADLPEAGDYVFDTAVPAVLDVLGDQLPVHVRAGLRRFRSGPAVTPVALVLDGPVPWADPAVALAGTVHVAGTVTEIVRAQEAVRRGRHAEHPVVLLGDPTVVDPGRARDGLRVVWSYAHVPFGSTRDVTDDVVGQIERYAPGVRERLVASMCTPAARLADHDEAMTGGDISLGAVTAWQMLARPRPAWDSHFLGHLPGGARAFLGSSAAVPGPGVHGMAGWLAAASLLRRRGLPMPDLRPQAGPGAARSHLPG